MSEELYAQEESETMCPQCGRAWASEYHKSDECVNLDKDKK